MTYNHIKILVHSRKIQFTLGTVLLLLGCSVYVLFRSRDIHLYQWASILRLTSYIESVRGLIGDLPIPDFVRFSLPDGLYCLSYILLMNSIWHGNGVTKHFVISVIPIMAILHEIAQGVGLAKGTFDVYDILCYITPLMAYFAFQKKIISLNN